MRRGQRWVGWFLGEDSRFATGFWTLRKVGTLDLGKCASRSKVPGVVSDARVETLMKSKVLWGYPVSVGHQKSTVVGGVLGIQLVHSGIPCQNLLERGR